MKKRAVLYARVSSSDREKHSLDAQIQMCREYAQDKGYAVVAELQEDERGVSGAAVDAPMLTQALEMAEQGEYDVLVCREMDRLARSLAKQMLVEERLAAAGVRVEYVLAEYDESPEGRLQKLVRASVAEYERLKIVERMERGRRAAVKRGSVMTAGHPPFGYREVELEDGRKSLEPDPDTAGHAKQIFKWYAYGDGKKARLSLRAVVRKLEERGVLSPADRGTTPYGHKKRPVGSWHATSVREILINPAFCGDWTYKAKSGTRLVVPIPPLVDRETWEIVQQRLKENLRLASRNTRHKYLLRGRIRCGKCGYTLNARKHRQRLYYRCSAAGRDDLRIQCDQRYIRVDRLDERVWECVANLFSEPGAVREAYERLNAAPQGEQAAAALKLVEVQSRRLEKRLVRLQHIYLDGDMERSVYRAKRDKIRDELKTLELRQDVLISRSRQSDYDALDTLEGFTEMVHGQIAGITDFDERLWHVDTLDIRALVTAERIALVSAHGVTIGTVECD